MSAPITALRGQLLSIEHARIERGWPGISADLIGRRARAKRLFVEAAVSAGQAPRKAWTTANRCQADIEREAKQCHLFGGAAA